MTIADRVAAVEERLRLAAQRAGRDPASVKLIAVSKRHPAETVREGLAAGLSRFGENFAQELVAKVEDIGTAPEWHFIGKLQRNKAKFVVGRAALIHAVDSAALVAEIDKRAANAGVVQHILLAVSVAGEAQKTGVAMGDVEALLKLAMEAPNVCCVGFMTMPPLPDEPEDSRPYYRTLARLRDRVATDSMPLPELSMGTTGDFEIAVEEGATLVRVGTSIFGRRPTP